MRSIVFILFLAFAVNGSGYSQTLVKGNCVYWLLGMPNVSVETVISDHLTASGELFYSPWKSVNGNPLQFLQFNPDVRWYPKRSFDGFYTGVYASVQDFKISKWNYWNLKEYQDGWGYGFGAMIGFQAILTDRWSLDVNAGGGWHHGRYRGYYKSTGKMYTDWNGSGEWLPYRLAISVCYRLQIPRINLGIIHW
jgi:hypothetical protein